MNLPPCRYSAHLEPVLFYPNCKRNFWPVVIAARFMIQGCDLWLAVLLDVLPTARRRNLEVSRRTSIDDRCRDRNCRIFGAHQILNVGLDFPIPR